MLKWRVIFFFLKAHGTSDIYRSMTQTTSQFIQLHFNTKNKFKVVGASQGASGL